MRRLSINEAEADGFYILAETPDTLVFNNEGSFLSYQGKLKKGVCLSCRNKYCINYLQEEYQTDLFDKFPHNTSFRVCPTNAISIKNGGGFINNELCLGCGLCLHRCPTAAIQLDFTTGKCFINTESDYKIKQYRSYQESEDIQYIKKFIHLPRHIEYNHISTSFSNQYHNSIINYSKYVPDLSEIIVRNTLINMGIKCHAAAIGNNHIRIEFFGLQNDKIIIGESNSKENDTLTVLRRILDDEAVMISRYKINKKNIVALSVLNNLPNKRTDYYEVVNDMENVLNLQVSTITFHALFVLNLFNIKLSLTEFESFVINRTNQDLTTYLQRYIPDIITIDQDNSSANYKPIK